MSTPLEEKLEAANISYEVMACDPEFADTAQFCEKYGFEMQDSANTILVASKSEPKEFVACIVLATDRLDVNSKVRKAMGVRKLSFATTEETTEMTGMAIGGVTPVGLPEDLRVWIDSKVLTRSKVVIGGGSRDCKILLDPNELLKLDKAVSADISKQFSVICAIGGRDSVSYVNDLLNDEK